MARSKAVSGSTHAWPAFFAIQKYSGKKPSVATVLPTSFSGNSVTQRRQSAASHEGCVVVVVVEVEASALEGVMEACGSARALPGRPL